MRSKRILILVVLLVAAAGVLWWSYSRGTSKLGQAAYEQTAVIVSKGPRPPGSDALNAVRAHLRSELEKAGWVTASQAFERNTPVGKRQFENLRFRFPQGGGDPWGSPVKGLLCAHMDSKEMKNMHFVGADDAASACAAIVEIGKYLARDKPEQAGQLELVFFDGEEAFGRNITPQDGLFGSRHYANYWRARDDKPEFGVLLDMIGHKDLTIKLPSDTPADLKDAVFSAAKAEDADQYFGMAAGPIIDDHVPLNFAGIPTVDIIGDFSRGGWWHTPADNMKIISAESLDISMRVVLSLLGGRLGE